MIGAFGQETVACPRCPVCDAEPTDWSREIRPWFCSDDSPGGCTVLSWNPDHDRAANLLDIEAIHDPTVCPLGGQPVAGVADPRCTCFAREETT